MARRLSFRSLALLLLLMTIAFLWQMPFSTLQPPPLPSFNPPNIHETSVPLLTATTSPEAPFLPTITPIFGQVWETFAVQLTSIQATPSPDETQRAFFYDKYLYFSLRQTQQVADATHAPAAMPLIATEGALSLLTPDPTEDANQPFYYLQGIIEDPGSQMTKRILFPTTMWAGEIDGQVLQIYAGSKYGDHNQGMLYILIHDPFSFVEISPREAYFTPNRGGPVKIIAMTDDHLTLQDASGQTCIYDAAARTFDLAACPAPATVQPVARTPPPPTRAPAYP